MSTISGNGHSNGTGRKPAARNVLGGKLKECSRAPLTGFFRDGCCDTGPDDHGVHVVCTMVTAEFLSFSKATGNDLSTPAPQFGFAGLQPGDRWCVCAARWKEALDAGMAAPVDLEATHEGALQYMSLAELKAHAIAD